MLLVPIVDRIVA